MRTLYYQQPVVFDKYGNLRSFFNLTDDGKIYLYGYEVKLTRNWCDIKDKPFI